MGKAAADALGDRHDVGRDPGALMREESAGAADARLHLVEDQQQALVVAKRPQGLEPFARHDPDATFALDGFDHHGAGLRADRGFERRPVVERHLIETIHLGAEAVDVLLLSTRRDRGQGAAVERAFERHDAETLRVAARRLVLAGHLDGGLVGFGTRIGEEDELREGGLDEAIGQPFAARDLVEVRRVPELAALLAQRLDEVRMRIAERRDRDATAEIEVTIAVLGEEPDTLAAIEDEIGAGIGGQDVRRHGKRHASTSRIPDSGSREAEKAASWAFRPAAAVRFSGAAGRLRAWTMTPFRPDRSLQGRKSNVPPRTGRHIVEIL